MLTAIAIAWIAGGVLLSGGGVGTVLTAINKKKIALKQEEIDDLQKLLLESQEREKDLICKTEKLEQDKKQLINRISELQIYLENIKEEQLSFNLKLQSNDTRFKRIIALLTFRLKKLKEENDLLRNKLDSIGVEIEDNVSQINTMQIESEDYETQIIKSLEELKVAKLAIQEISEELSQAS